MLECKQEPEFYGFSQGWRPRQVGEDTGAQDVQAQVAREMQDAQEALGAASIYELDDSAYAVEDPELPWDEPLPRACAGSSAAGEEGDQWQGVAAATGGMQGADTQPHEDSEPLAPLVAVVSGSGGTGRSTLAFLAACLAAQQGVDTVLLEGDLQFGDYGFWLGIDDDASSLADPSNCKPIACPQGFDLYKAPVFPEVADKVSDELALNLDRIRAGRGLVIADTGAYWSGFTASLLLQCDIFLMVTDQRPSSVAAAIKASELCSRLGVPSTRMVVACNRYNSRCALSAQEVARALGVDKAHCIPDGREVVEELCRNGEFEELAQSGNPTVAATSMLLKAVLPRMGIACDLESFRKKGLFR